MQKKLNLEYGFEFNDLLRVEGLKRIDETFLTFLEQTAKDKKQALLNYRSGVEMGPVELSDFLIDLAPEVEAFVQSLFHVETEVTALRARIQNEYVVQWFKKQVVLKRARRHRQPIDATFGQLNQWLQNCIEDSGLDGKERETAVAVLAERWHLDPDGFETYINKLIQWCALALNDAEGRRQTGHWQSFKLPQPVDFDALVPLEQVADDEYGRLQSNPDRFKQRDGFALTDKRMSIRQIEDQVHYCVYCHKQNGDFCTKGFPVKKNNPELGLKVNPLDESLTGCPLEEKISEMHYLRREGHTIAALAVAMRDNPMVPATGHRICNDCMKACIYQKQEPVNIPQIETRILTDVLDLPWGVEIYDLLTRWNPLRDSQFVMKPYNGRNVLIAGMGPAGFTMAHHLTMEGCGVVGIDGLKIEPLPETLLISPVASYGEMTESLDDRILMGFGGVAEYGITVRWDKNFLKLIYLTLARRRNFQVFGGVRFGGTLEVEDAWRMGMDHVVVACGAGYPKVLNIENGLARGVRQANDFLMALQLTGAAKESSLASLQIRLPAAVIGSGLTAIDTATELQAYYIKQVEKIYRRYLQMAADGNDDMLFGSLDDESKFILREYLDHGKAVHDERQEAKKENRSPDFLSLLRQWGGVTIVYRRNMSASPAYRRNHEEIIKAMEEGLYYLEDTEPVGVKLDDYGYVRALECRRSQQTDTFELPARAVMVAAGSKPNTIYEHEHPGHFDIDGDHYRPHVDGGELRAVETGKHCKVEPFGPFTSYRKNKYRVSFIGDAHPVYHGSVVKAVASAKRTYPQVMAALDRQVLPPQTAEQYRDFQKRLETALQPKIVSMTPKNNMIEMWVRAPLAAQKFKPGQFFRLQTFESLSPVEHQTRMQIPLQTISGAGIKGDNIRLLLLRFGANARLAERMKPGDPLVLMGPNGEPSAIPRNKTVLIIAGSWGTAVMLDLGPALRNAGNKVLYVAALRNENDLNFKDELEQACDQVVWATATEPLIPAGRDQDSSIQEANVIKLLQRYEANRNNQSQLSLGDVDEVLVMGSSGLLQALQRAFKNELRRIFRDDVTVIGTVGSPMQCMLKGVCAQCLQWQMDPVSGRHTRAVFTCAMQDQPLDAVDLDNLSARQRQNRVADYMTQQWVDHILAKNQ